MTTTEKVQEVQRVAETLYSQGPDWATFYREILGLEGVMRHTFPTQESLAEFEESQAYQEIQHMLTRLREQRPPAANPDDPTRVITVRLPKCLHEALRAEAHDHRTSMNKLCISKLLQFIDNQLVPSDA